MNECACNSCKNLKPIMDENGNINEYECEYGFPSEDCENCEDGVCEAECEHYEREEENNYERIVKCKACGKELRQYYNDNEDGDVYCVDCYLKNEK